jgi:hypothetical protein
MTHGSGYFGYESIVLVALAVLAVVMLSAFANAALNPAVLG